MAIRIVRRGRLTCSTRFRHSLRSASRGSPSSRARYAPEAGLFQDERDFVDGVGRGHRDNGVAIDVAEECDLFDVVGDRAFGASDDDVGLDAEGAARARSAGSVSFQLTAADLGNQCDVDIERVLAADLPAELADRLDERLPLDVSDRAADLDDDDVGVMLPGSESQALLDLIGNVRDDLDRAAEIVTAAFLGDDGRVDLTGCHIRRSRQVLVGKRS